MGSMYLSGMTTLRLLFPLGSLEFHTGKASLWHLFPRPIPAAHRGANAEYAAPYVSENPARGVLRWIAGLLEGGRRWPQSPVAVFTYPPQHADCRAGFGCRPMATDVISLLKSTGSGPATITWPSMTGIAAHQSWRRTYAPYEIFISLAIIYMINHVFIAVNSCPGKNAWLGPAIR